MTIASRLKLNIGLSTTVVFLMIVAFGAALLIERDIRARSLFADQLMRGAFELSLLSDYYIRHPEARPQRQWQHKYAVLLELLKDRRDDHGEQARLESIYQSLRDNGALFQELMGTYASGRSDDPLARSQREQLADLMIMRSRTIAESAAQMVADTRAEMAAVTRQIGVAFPVLSLLVLALTIWSATRIRTSIAGPIEQLRQGAAIIGTGQLDYRIGLASADELGELAGEFDRMAQRLKGITVSRDELMKEMAERQQAEAARKQAEEALRESELRMRALLDASQDEILLVSTSGIVLATNEAAERRMTKRSGKPDPVGDHLDQLLPQDEAEQKMATIGQVASTATVVYRESEVRSRSYECWYFPALSPDRSVSAVAVYARDVTERNKAFAEVRKLSQAIEHSPSTVFITDGNGTIEYVNPKFTEMTGYTSAEAVGQNPRMLKSGQTPPEYYAELWNTIRSGGVWRGELLNKKKNGELYWEFASIAPVKDGQTITNFVAVMEDVTLHREREEQLRQAQKMEAVGQLTGGIAHDFNNLLAIVMGNLQLLEGIVGDHAEAREYLDDAIWSTKRGGELTRRLLAFARKQPLKPAVVDLNDVVRGMGELLRRTLGASIEIEETLAPDLWKAVVDPRELEQALINLAVNSRDAMPNGGTLALTTRNVQLGEDYAAQYPEVRPGDYALLEIVDTGTGMPSEIVSRVFEPFFTTKEFGKGSGLGLSMVYGFVKQSHGHASIYSQVGRGTCVKLYLPRAPSASLRVAEASPDVSTAGLVGKVVLVVEDEAKLRKVAVKMLERLGMPIIHAENGKSALDLLARTHVDVLFTDIELPGGMNGLDLVEAARRLRPGHQGVVHHRLHERVCAGRQVATGNRLPG